MQLDLDGSCSASSRAWLSCAVSGSSAKTLALVWPGRLPRGPYRIRGRRCVYR
jgi:hypothetical protein